MIGADRVEQERIQVLNQVLNAGGAASLPSVANYLITLYYQQFLADRQGLDLPDEYEMLSIPFASATGKQLLKPEYHARAGSSVEVELPSGHRHGLSDLSSGEQAMLALMFFVRRLSASGGTLCLDEPEQHLHPSLQAAVFELMRQMGRQIADSARKSFCQSRRSSTDRGSCSSGACDRHVDEPTTSIGGFARQVATDCRTQTDACRPFPARHDPCS